MEDLFQLGIKALIRNLDGKILLLQINPKKLIKHDGTIYWDIPGGRVKKGSTILETLKTEIAEEIGVTEITTISKINAVLSNVRIPIKGTTESYGLILMIYQCKIPGSTQIALSDEHTEYGWFTPKEAANKLSYKYPKEFTDKILELE